MKAIITKMLLFFRDLFLRLHVVVKLHIGWSKSGKEDSELEDSQQDDNSGEEDNL